MLFDEEALLFDDVQLQDTMCIGPGSDDISPASFEMDVDAQQQQPFLKPMGENSLPEYHGTAFVPSGDNVPWWKMFYAYVGPGALIAVGYACLTYLSSTCIAIMDIAIWLM